MAAAWQGKDAPLSEAFMTISFSVLLPDALSFFWPSIRLFSFLGSNVSLLQLSISHVF